MKFFKSYATMFRREFRGYNAARLLKDLLAGLTVAAVALPLALAFGQASVGPEHTAVGIAAGLITAIVAGIVTGALGGGSFQISGPTGAMTVILGGIVSGAYGLSGMFVASLLAGILLLLAGVLHVGRLIRFIPRPVVVGFTSGIALVIALGQLGNFFGVTLSGESTLDKVIFFFKETLSDIHLPTVLCSLAVVLIMLVYPKRFAKYVPGSLISIILITAVVAIFNVNVGTIGEISRSLVNSERLHLSSLSLDMILDLLSPALTIAALGMVESLLCGTCAANMKNEPFDSDIELVAQGVGNIVIPFFGGVPSTAAIARTSVAIKSGGQTRLTGIFQALFLILCMFLLPGVIGMVPYAALAGVLMVTAVRMNEWHAIKRYFKGKLWDAILMFLVTMVATVLLDLTYAILIGIVLSLVLILVRLSRARFARVPDPAPDTALVKCETAAFFANQEGLAALLEECVTNDAACVILSLEGVQYVDASFAIRLLELYEEIAPRGKQLCIYGADESALAIFKKAGLLDALGKDAILTELPS